MFCRKWAFLLLILTFNYIRAIVSTADHLSTLVDKIKR